MADFPTIVTTNGDPTAANTLANAPHAENHQSHNAEIKATQTKLGIGVSTPSSGKVLRSTATGSSTWGQLDLTTDVASFTSAALRAVLSDETGTGAAVFGTSPTIATPVVTGGTFSSPALTTPTVATSINDTNGNEVIKIPATASATNEITITNAPSGTAPSIAATGSSDTNIDLVLTPKGTGTVKTSPVSRIDQSALPLGSMVQTVSANFSAVATGTTVIPEDDTIPQITEGTEFMTLAITPKATTNHLVIRVEASVSTSNTNSAIGALFQDATANALAAKETYIATANATGILVITSDVVAGTVSSTTFRFRSGPAVAGTLTFNGFSGARKFGGITLSNISITEYKA